MRHLEEIRSLEEETLAELAAQAPEEEKPPAKTSAEGKKTRRQDLGEFDCERYLTHYGIACNVITRGDRTLYRLDHCLFNPAHGRNDAYVHKARDGVLSYCCSHNSCKNDPSVNWTSARKIISGEDSLASFYSNYDPAWKPAERKRRAIDPEEMGFLTVNDKGRVQFKAALMADYLQRRFEPMMNEGKDFGGVFYRYNQEKGLWKLFPEAAIRQVARELLGDEAQPRRISDTISLLMDQTYMPAEVLQGDPMWLNLKNCMLHLQTGETMPHAPEFYSRVQLAVSHNPKARCSTWVEALAGIFVDDLSKADVIQEFFGYCLYPKIIFPCALFQIGAGRNGKGTVQKVLEAMLGDENVCHISLKRLEDRFGAVELRDKLLNACGETSSTPLEVTRFKEVAAADRVQAEKKYKDDVIFIPIAKHMISMNEFPGIKDKTDAFFRRVIVMEYKQKFEADQEDVHLSDRIIEQELDGVFMWSLEGLRRVLDQGAIKQPESVIQAKKRFRARVNPVLMFVEETCSLGPGFSILPADLFGAYKRWCEEAKTNNLGKQRFYEQIQTNYSVEKKRDGTKERFFGINVNQTDQMEI